MFKVINRVIVMQLKFNLYDLTFISELREVSKK